MAPFILEEVSADIYKQHGYEELSSVSSSFDSVNDKWETKRKPISPTQILHSWERGLRRLGPNLRVLVIAHSMLLFEPSYRRCDKKPVYNQTIEWIQEWQHLTPGLLQLYLTHSWDDLLSSRDAFEFEGRGFDTLCVPCGCGEDECLLTHEWECMEATEFSYSSLGHIYDTIGIADKDPFIYVL